MTETLAQLLSARVAAALPFLSTGRAVGLARLYTTINGEEPPQPIKLPVPIEYTAAECEQSSRYLVPDEATPAILFFEDGGTQQVVNAQTPARDGVRTASLKLLLWVNIPLLAGPLDEVSLLAAVTQALRPGERYPLGPFLDLLLSYQVLPAETSLYGRYSFDDKTPLLLPPYRLLGLNLTIQFRVNLRCLTPVLPSALTSAVSCP